MIRHFFIFGALASVASLALSASATLNSNVKVEFWVGISKDKCADPDTILAQLNATAIGVNVYLTDVTFPVRFLDSRGRVIATDNFVFPGNDGERLDNHFFETCLPYSHPAAQTARAGRLRYKWGWKIPMVIRPGLNEPGEETEAANETQLSADPDEVFLGSPSAAMPAGTTARGLPRDLSEKLKELANAGSDIQYVTVTPQGTWVILFDGDGYANSGGIPKEAINKLHELNGERRHTIHGINFSGNGGWVIYYDKNGFLESGTPLGVYEELVKLNEADDSIDCVAFAPGGGWLVIYDGTNYFFDGIPQLLGDQIAQLNKENRRIRQVAFTPEAGAAIVTDEPSSGACQNIPDEACEALMQLSKTSKTIKTITFTPNGGWLIVHSK